MTPLQKWGLSFLYCLVKILFCFLLALRSPWDRLKLVFISAPNLELVFDSPLTPATNFTLFQNYLLSALVTQYILFHTCGMFCLKYYRLVKEKVVLNLGDCLDKGGSVIDFEIFFLFFCLLKRSEEQTSGSRLIWRISLQSRWVTITVIVMANSIPLATNCYRIPYLYVLGGWLLLLPFPFLVTRVTILPLPYRLIKAVFFLSLLFKATI